MTKKAESIIEMFKSLDKEFHTLASSIINGFIQNNSNDEILNDLCVYFEQKREEGDLRYSKTLYKKNDEELFHAAIELDQWKKRQFNANTC